MIIHRFVARLPDWNFVNKNRSYAMPSIRLVTFLTSLALVATLRTATPKPAENPVTTPHPLEARTD
jgi:hypothetical protein